MRFHKVEESTLSTPFGPPPISDTPVVFRVEPVAPFGNEPVAPFGDDPVAPFGGEPVAPFGGEPVAPFG